MSNDETIQSNPPTKTKSGSLVNTLRSSLEANTSSQINVWDNPAIGLKEISLTDLSLDVMMCVFYVLFWFIVCVPFVALIRFVYYVAVKTFSYTVSLIKKEETKVFVQKEE
jgi:hypothetical protein